ncbi:MAG: DUF4423 domain-containing protein, partial [Bdellovibrionales bacterium]
MQPTVERPKIMSPVEFRVKLQTELTNRIANNPRYSLRAFARFLEIDPSTLSQLLRGMRKFSNEQIETIGTKIGLSPRDVKALKNLNQKKASGEQSWRNDNYDLTHDMFQIIADWYHYAIFELVTIKNFKNDTKWIASKLGISASEAEFAVERLLRLGLLVRQEDGGLAKGSLNISTTSSPFTSAAFRKMQEQLLQKAIQAMETVPMSQRDQSSMTMAIDTSLMDAAKEKIKNFRRELCDFFQ